MIVVLNIKLQNASQYISFPNDLLGITKKRTTEIDFGLNLKKKIIII
jgi:hypothetical protein